MATQNDALFAAVTELERLLPTSAAGREQTWCARIDQALAAVEQAMRQRADALAAPGEGLVAVDRPQLPSPAVARRAEALRRQLTSLIEEAIALRTKVQSAARAFGLGASPPDLAGVGPRPPETSAIPDFGAFCQHARELLDGLRHYETEEARLILDSITPDIGAGD